MIANAFKVLIQAYDNEENSLVFWFNTELVHRCISFALSHFEAISLRQSKTTPKRHHVMSLTTTQLIFIIADIAIKVFKRQIKVYGQ
jgi:hypothetical protein